MLEVMQQIRGIAARWRVPLTLAGAALFAAGLALSAGSLKITAGQLDVWPVVLTLFVLGPLTLVLAAINLQLIAQAVGRRIGFLDAFAVSSVSRIAEVLPLPGGALVRGAALMRAGAGFGESIWFVTLTALLTLFMAAAVGGLALTLSGFGIGYLVLLVAAAGAAVSLLPIVRRAGVRIALAMIAVRIVVLALGVTRFAAAFAAIGLALQPADAALFVICGTLGTSVAIIPAGLGVSEAIAAALALLIQVPPPAAFLATALNRVLGLAVSGVVCLAFAISIKLPNES